MFIKISILTCAVLHLNFVHSYTSEELHKLYEDNVMKKEHNNTIIIDLSHWKNIWVSLCECVYQNLRKKNKYREAYLSYYYFKKETFPNHGPRLIKLDKNYLLQYKEYKIYQNLTPCYGRRLVMPEGTNPKVEKLFEHIAFFIVPEMPHDIVVFRKMKEQLYTLFDWIEYKIIVNTLTGTTITDSIFHYPYSLDNSLSVSYFPNIFNIKPAISYNEENSKAVILKTIHDDEMAYEGKMLGQDQLSWLFTRKFIPDDSWLTSKLRIVYLSASFSSKRDIFAKLCKMALRRSAYPHFIVDMKSILEKPINTIQRKVKVEDYEWTVQMYPCSGFNVYENSHGEVIIDDRLDEETYTLSDGILQDSMIVYKHTDDYYEIIEMIGELDEYYVSPIDDDTEMNTTDEHHR